MLAQYFKNWSLQKQIVLVIGITILLVGIVAAEFARTAEKDAFQRNFHYQAEKLVAMLSSTLLDAIVSEDRPVLQTAIQQLLENDKDVTGIRIVNEYDETLASWYSIEENVSVSTEDAIDFAHDVALEGENFGHIEVSWNVEKQHSEINDHARAIYLFSIGISSALALIVLGVIHLLVVKPINKIHHHLQRLQANDNSHSLNVNASRELRDLGETINELGNVLELRKLKEIELEEASKSKSEFLANMSHELRTPMNGVLGMLSIIKESKLSPEQRQQVNVAMSSGKSLLTIISDILDFSKIEAGKLEFEKIPFDLVKLVEETADVVAEGTYKKGLELICNVGSDVHSSVIGDPTRIRQVLTNLSGNAVKFTQEGEIQIRVEHTNTESYPNRLRFSVTDTGVGIKESELDSIFQSFAQADGSTTRKYGGTGLGLAISRQLIEGMGGTIGTISTVGEGSQFWFELDLERSESIDTEEIVANLKGKRVLLIEANDNVRLHIKGLMNTHGIKVHSTHSASNALCQLRKAVKTDSPYDLVLFNAKLSDMPGEVFVRCIEADPAFDHLKLVPMTYITQQVQALYPHHNARIHAQISKPVKARELHQVLANSMALTYKKSTPDIADDEAKLALYSQLRILVVEDNPVNQAVALGIIENIGFDADVADNGREGLDKLANEHFDLVLMDCQMPVLDGYAATRELRASEKNGARKPVIALTANAMTGDEEKCREAGMDDYLCKPFEPEILEQKVVSMLSGLINDIEESMAASSIRKAA